MNSAPASRALADVKQTQTMLFFLWVIILAYFLWFRVLLVLVTLFFFLR